MTTDDFTPKYPKGTPEYEEYAARLRIELDKFRRGEGAYFPGVDKK